MKQPHRKGKELSTKDVFLPHLSAIQPPTGPPNIAPTREDAYSIMKVVIVKLTCTTDNGQVSCLDSQPGGRTSYIISRKWSSKESNEKQFNCFPKGCFSGSERFQPELLQDHEDKCLQNCQYKLDSREDISYTCITNTCMSTWVLGVLYLHQRYLRGEH